MTKTTKTSSHRIEYGPMASDNSQLKPVRWYLDDDQVSEYEYYGLSQDSVIADLGPEPFSYHDYQEWQHKKYLLERLSSAAATLATTNFKSEITKWQNKLNNAINCSPKDCNPNMTQNCLDTLNYYVNLEIEVQAQYTPKS
jgi:hypothetical protein